MIDLTPYAFVDCETDGLSTDKQPWEIAVLTWRDGDWSETVIVISDFNDDAMTAGAARANGFYQRYETCGGLRLTKVGAAALVSRLLEGKRVVGSNPGFDVEALVNLGCAQTWHYQKRDVPSMFLGHAGYEAPGLESCCAALEVVNEAPHTALGDARAARDCFLAMMQAVRV